MKGTSVLPDDPALPGLRAIRAVGVAGAILTLGLDDAAVELRLRAHKPGAHATLEARASDRHFAVKVYAKDPAPEAELHQALAAVGVAPSRPASGLASGVCVPPLLAWERDLRVLVVGWLEGPTAHELLKGGQGERAGELVARWLQRTAALRPQVKLGPPFGAPQVLRRAGKWVAAFEAADASLGTAASRLAGMLARTEPRGETAHLVHGSLHDRNILDIGGAPGVPGVIDWQRFGQGPVEVEAGMFLAAVSRLELMHEALAREMARAEATFLAGAGDLLRESALAWHRAAGLMRLARRQLNHPKGDTVARAHALLGAAARFAEASG